MREAKGKGTNLVANMDPIMFVNVFLASDLGPYNVWSYLVYKY